MSWKKKFSKLYERSLKKAGSKPTAFDERVRDTARREGLSNDEALFIIASKLGVQFTRDVSNLSADSRTRMASIMNSARRHSSTPTTTRKNTEEKLIGSSRYFDILEVFKDTELRDRCADLIKRPRNHDRAFREATTVLENRLRRLSGVSGMNPQNLIGKVISPDPSKAVLVVSTDTAEQEGFFKICSGIEALFRNRTHHEVTDKLTREDAIKFCFFIDSLLVMLSAASVHSDRV